MVKDIMIEAKRKAKENRAILLSIFFMISMLELMQTLSVQLGIIGIFLLVFLTASNHGAVIAGLKITEQIQEPIDPQKDGFSGVKRIKTLFSTYFEMDIITSCLTLFVLFLISTIATYFAPTDFLETIFESILSESAYGISDTAKQLFKVVLVVIGLVSMVCGFIVDWLFFTAPYDLEMSGIHGLRALKEAVHKANGYRREIFALLFHYGVIAIVFSCLDYLATIYIPGLLLSSLASMFILILGIYLYKMEFAIAKAMLYERISQRKED